MTCSMPGSSVHGISQERILEWVAISFSRGSSQPRDCTHVSCTVRQILYYSVQFRCSVVSNSLQPHGLYHASPLCPSPTPRVYSNSCSLSQWCHPTISSSVLPFSFCLQSFPASGSFPKESVLCIRWPKYWSFSFSPSPSNEYSGLISFRNDWFDPLVVQGTLKNVQHHSSKASVLQRSVFFMVQLSHLHVTTEKSIALTIQTLSAKQCLHFLICCLVLS